MLCDTLWIDTDRGICTLTWRGHVPLEVRTQAVRVLVAMEERGLRISWEDVVAMARARGGHAGEQQEAGFDAESTAPLGGAGETMALSPAAVAKPVLSFAEGVGEAARSSQTRAAEGGLPFSQASGPGPPPGVAPPPMVRATATGEPMVPGMVTSPWAAQAAP